jgi:hypothetical protein
MKKLKDWTVDVLSKRFVVAWRSPAGGKDFGDCDSSKCLIQVCPKQHAEQQKDTLLHECVHALDHELDTKMSERQVRLISTGLLHFLRHNPEVVRWVIEH